MTTSAIASDAASIASSVWSAETKVNEPIATPGPRRRPARYLVLKQVCQKKHETQRQFLKRVSSEYCILSAVKHNNVVHAVDLLMEDYQFFIVMGLRDPGTPLMNWLRTTVIDDAAQQRQLHLTLFVQLVAAIGYIHATGIAHRDIHPDNLIMVNRTLKLTNFSSAAVFRPPLQHTVLPCTEPVYHDHGAYLAPETLPWWQPRMYFSGNETESRVSAQYESITRSRTYDAAAMDMWSVGIMLGFLWQDHTHWKRASETKDSEYAIFARQFGRRNYHGFATIPRALRTLVYDLLCPSPSQRIDAQELDARLNAISS
ncbi:kinase-like domain-containing protein [Gongronella butleri]|nr:kinase-like domain-containing protein [Gongronella butleri]